MRHEHSFDTYSPEALREISRRGGVASGKARREKRRRIEERKTEELIRMGIIVDGISALKQIYRALPPEDQLALHEYQNGAGAAGSRRGQPKMSKGE